MMRKKLPSDKRTKRWKVQIDDEILKAHKAGAEDELIVLINQQIESLKHAAYTLLLYQKSKHKRSANNAYQILKALDPGAKFEGETITSKYIILTYATPDIDANRTGASDL